MKYFTVLILMLLLLDIAAIATATYDPQAEQRAPVPQELAALQLPGRLMKASMVFPPPNFNYHLQQYFVGKFRP